MDNSLIAKLDADKPLVPLLIIKMVEWIDPSEKPIPSTLLALMRDDLDEDPETRALFTLLDEYKNKLDYLWEPHTSDDVPDDALAFLRDEDDFDEDEQYYVHLLALNIYHPKLASDVKPLCRP